MKGLELVIRKAGNKLGFGDKAKAAAGGVKDWLKDNPKKALAGAALATAGGVALSDDDDEPKKKKKKKMPAYLDEE